MYSIKLDIGNGYKVIDDDVTGHNEITISIVRENDEFGNRVLRERVDVGKLIISGNTYTSLTAMSPCISIKMQIWNVCSKKSELKWEGIIFVKDILIRPYYGIAEIQSVYDAGYSSAIDLNKNKKIYLNTKRSTNNSTIGITSTSLLFLNALNGTPTISRVVWDILDVLKLFVSYCTDGQALVQSNYFTTNKYYITTVARLCNAPISSNKSEEFPELSLQDVMQELFKALTITSRFENNGVKTLYVEPSDSFFLSDVSTKLERSKSDTFVFNTKNNYETIEIGSNTFIEIQTLDRIDDYSDSGLHSFRNIEINGCGSCNNRDNALNLSNEWIIDSDYIHTCIISPIGIEVDDYSKIVLIHGNSTAAITTINGSNFSYNESLNNNNKLLKHLKFIPSCVNKYYGENGNFKATNGFAIIYDIPSMGIGNHSVNLWSSSLYGQIDQIDQVLYNESPINYNSITSIWNNNTGTTINKLFNFSTQIIVDRSVGFGENVVSYKVTVTVEIRHMNSTFTVTKNSKSKSIEVPLPLPFILNDISVTTDNWALAPSDKVLVFMTLKYKGRGKVHIEIPLEKMEFMSMDDSSYIDGNIFISDNNSFNNYIISNSGVIKQDIFDTARLSPMSYVDIQGVFAYINEFKYNYNTGEYSFTGETNQINTCYDK